VQNDICGVVIFAIVDSYPQQMNIEASGVYEMTKENFKVIETLLSPYVSFDVLNKHGTFYTYKFSNFSEIPRSFNDAVSFAEFI
jgi:hypothetical protein